MTEDILGRLFYGEVSPFDDSVEDIETFRDLNSKMAEVWSKIDEQASPELAILMMSIMNTQATTRCGIVILRGIPFTN